MAAFWPLARRGLAFLADVIRPRHGVESRTRAWLAGRGSDDLDPVRRILGQLESALLRLAGRRRAKAVSRTKLWVRLQEAHVGHRCTKSRIAPLAHSASADKAHMGEGNTQEAVDEGGRDWDTTWLGKK